MRNYLLKSPICKRIHLTAGTHSSFGFGCIDLKILIIVELKCFLDRNHFNEVDRDLRINPVTLKVVVMLVREKVR